MNRYHAVVLAGDRGPQDALCRAADVPCRALVPLAGRPLIDAALGALREAPSVASVTVTEPQSEALRRRYEAERPELVWIPSAASPAASVLAALDAHAASASASESHVPVLVTTADHVLLRAEIVEDFLERARGQDAALVFGVTRLEGVRAAFPELKKTPHRLRDGSWSGANLFLFQREPARRVAEAWRAVERDRKRPWRVARRFGLGFLLRFLLGRMSLADATEGIGDRVGATIRAVELPFPEASVDVDSIDDWKALSTRLEARS
jgi:molybdopterin-guanine dinucleotide biosynthesis protein A